MRAVDLRQVDCFGDKSPRNDGVEPLESSLRDSTRSVESWQSTQDLQATFRANEENLSKVCAEIQARIAKNRHIIFLLQGDIGAGKTTLVKAFAKYVKIKDSVTSPTFSLLHIYGDKIHHYDLYQKGVDYAMDLGLLDLLEQSGIHFVEWGDSQLFNILKNAFENICIISIHKTKNDRIYEFKESF